MSWITVKKAIISGLLLYGIASPAQNLSDKVSISAKELGFCEDIYFKERSLEKDTLLLRDALRSYEKKDSLSLQRINVLNQEMIARQEEQILLKKAVADYQKAELKAARKNKFLTKVAIGGSVICLGLGMLLAYKLGL